MKQAAPLLTALIFTFQTYAQQSGTPPAAQSQTEHSQAPEKAPVIDTPEKGIDVAQDIMSRAKALQSILSPYISKDSRSPDRTDQQKQADDYNKQLSGLASEAYVGRAVCAVPPQKEHLQHWLKQIGDIRKRIIELEKDVNDFVTPLAPPAPEGNRPPQP